MYSVSILSFWAVLYYATLCWAGLGWIGRGGQDCSHAITRSWQALAPPPSTKHHNTIPKHRSKKPMAQYIAHIDTLFHSLSYSTTTTKKKLEKKKKGKKKVKLKSPIYPTSHQPSFQKKKEEKFVYNKVRVVCVGGIYPTRKKEKRKKNNITKRR